MSELRKDPIVDRWVIIAPERANRPVQLKSGPITRSSDFCPFCEGNERYTPPEVFACRDAASNANEKGWRVRVIPNMFPALTVGGDLKKCDDGIFHNMNGIGVHEVIIECPFHEVSLASLSEVHLRAVLGVYRDRLVELKKDRRLVYGLIFKNEGFVAGASLEHAHSQVIAMPIVPVSVREELASAMEFFKDQGRCIYCDLIDQEVSAKNRVIIETTNFVGIAPYASRFPFEMWILPRNHNSHFETINNHVLDELGTVLKTVLMKLEITLDHPSYNYIIHTSPFDVQGLTHYHWHLEIMPRTTSVAGFEWGTGFHINSVPPEQAAEYLRGVNVDVTGGRKC